MVQDSPSRRQDQFVVRLPDGMRERIAEVAKANGRSMNAEIISRLEQSFDPTLTITKEDSNRYISQAKEAFEAQFKSALTKAAESLGQIIIEEPELFLNNFREGVKRK